MRSSEFVDWWEKNNDDERWPKVDWLVTAKFIVGWIYSAKWICEHESGMLRGWDVQSRRRWNWWLRSIWQWEGFDTNWVVRSGENDRDPWWLLLGLEDEARWLRCRWGWVPWLWLKRDWVRCSMGFQCFSTTTDYQIFTGLGGSQQWAGWLWSKWGSAWGWWRSCGLRNTKARLDLGVDLKLDWISWHWSCQKQRSGWVLMVVIKLKQGVCQWDWSGTPNSPCDDDWWCEKML